MAKVLALPYVEAGSGGSSSSFEVVNVGDEVVEGPGGADLAWTLDGDQRLSIVQAPPRLAPGMQESLVLAFAGAAAESIATATLSVQTDTQLVTATVHAVAGEPGLEDGSWQTVLLPGGVPCGDDLTISLPTAPFPDTSAGFTDDTVRIFVPESLRDVGSQDVVVHFHGHNTDVDETLSAHRYEEHFCASGVNGILVVPQGPVHTASGNFGKLMAPGGLEALVHQVLVVLYREERILSPLVGDLVLTAHSGGYLAVATNLNPAVNPLSVSQVDLFDALYAQQSAFVAFVEAGGVLRSNYTPTGGTTNLNLEVIDTLEQGGVTVVTEPTQAALRDAPVIIYAADTTHTGATRLDGAFGEQLRFGMRHHRRGPRIELREAVVIGGNAQVRWFAPYDDEVLGFRVLTSAAGGPWKLAAETAANEDSATFALSGGARVRVEPVVPDLVDTIGSDVYYLADSGDALVIDGFDRVIDGSFGGLSHDFAALVGEAAGAAGTVSNEALTEGGFGLSAAAAIWLLGDESTADRPFTPAERNVLVDYVLSGGSVIVSGSEVAYDLDFTAAGSSLLADIFGASFAADDSNSYAVSGVGSVASVGSFTYAGPAAPYEEDYPDVLAAVGTGEPLLEYAGGAFAAVGVANKSALVGFPLELVDGEAERAAVLTALLGFVH